MVGAPTADGAAPEQERSGHVGVAGRRVGLERAGRVPGHVVAERPQRPHDETRAVDAAGHVDTAPHVGGADSQAGLSDQVGRDHVLGLALHVVGDPIDDLPGDGLAGLPESATEVAAPDELVHRAAHEVLDRTERVGDDVGRLGRLVRDPVPCGLRAGLDGAPDTAVGEGPVRSHVPAGDGPATAGRPVHRGDHAGPADGARPLRPHDGLATG